MTFRIEDKLFVKTENLFQFYEFLYENSAKKIFEPRKIKSLYFDNLKFEMYRDSIEGSVPRKKIRVREYPDSKDKKYYFEMKTSSVEGRFKTREIIDEEKFSFLQKYGYLDKTYGNCLPNFYVTYDREYSKIKDVRISIDKNIVYTNFLTKKSYFDNKSIVELKTSIDKNLDELVEMFPFQKIRFSKYCFAVESLN
tara:strand:- start:62 stop:649 length:588 start_codon:yes stop_codon:yes gene_type:complete